MDANTHTHTNVNAGILAMRAANAARKLGLAPRDADAPKPERKPKPTKASAPETPEQMRAYRVVVLVKAGESVTHVTLDVSAAGPRRAGRAARAEALRLGHEPVGVAATLSDECPTALWAACPALVKQA